jgi:hypothetical protein
VAGETREGGPTVRRVGQAQATGEVAQLAGAELREEVHVLGNGGVGEPAAVEVLLEAGEREGGHV